MVTHDHSIAVMRDGHVLTVVQLERYTGVKHDNRLAEFLPELLDKFLPDDDELRVVSCNHFTGDNFCSTDGNFQIEPEYEPDVASILTPARCLWRQKGRKKSRITEAHIICHEFAHIASCLPFCQRFLPNSLLVHIDGGAS